MKIFCLNVYTHPYLFSNNFVFSLSAIKASITYEYLFKLLFSYYSFMCFLQFCMYFLIHFSDFTWLYKCLRTSQNLVLVFSFNTVFINHHLINPISSCWGSLWKQKIIFDFLSHKVVGVMRTLKLERHFVLLNVLICFLFYSYQAMTCFFLLINH